MQDLGFSIVLDTRVCLFSVAMHWLTSGNLLGLGQVWPGKTADCLHGNNSCKHVHGSQMDWSGMHFFVATPKPLVWGSFSSNIRWCTTEQPKIVSAINLEKEDHHMHHPPFVDGNDTWLISGILNPGYHVQRGPWNSSAVSVAIIRSSRYLYNNI